MYMTNEQKKQVRNALIRYTGNFETQQKAAESLEGVSASTMSQVKNNNWEMISDKLWQNLARQVGFYCGDWQPADTSAHLLLRILFSDAQHYAMTYGIAIGEGLGKTFTSLHYLRENDHVYYIAGKEQYNRRTFMCALLNAVGENAAGSSPDMIRQFTAHIAEKEEALIIVDDAEKLKDRVLHLLILLANNLAGKAGIVILGNDKLRVRITEGVRTGKTGFDEIFRSIGRRFVTLGCLGPNDVELVCMANGVIDTDAIDHIREESEGNLHAVQRMIQGYNNMSVAA